MKRTFFSLFLTLASLTTQAQVDFKLYFANNIGDLPHVPKVSMYDTQLKWEAVNDRTIYVTTPKVNKVKEMFSLKRQKNREDQQLFWKMRDDNLLCFRINDGKGTSGQFEARVRTASKGKNGKQRTLMKHVSSYFFITSGSQKDTLYITLNRVGCSSSPQDTLHFTYFIDNWDDSDLLLFKLDSKRRSTGQTYQLEYVLRNEANEDTKEVLKLSGSSFQSFYVPKDKVLKKVFLVSEGKNRVALNLSRLVTGVNLSDKLNRLWMDDNFTLDKHENRELTVFNMLGSGLFEKFDTLSLTILGKGGKPIQSEVINKQGKGFTFHVAQVDENGKYVKELKDGYVDYNPKTGVHKILTYGNPCYIEVFAPGHLPAVFKYGGAMDPKDGVMSRDRLSGELHLISGQPTANGPDVAGQMIYALNNTNTTAKRDGKTYQLFTVTSEDLTTVSSSDSKKFMEDGAWQKTPKMLDDKPVEKYAEIGFTYSRSKSQPQANPTLIFSEVNSDATHTAVPTSSSKVDGNDYPCFTRSYYEQRWNLVDLLPKKDTEYKPRLYFGEGMKPFEKIPYIIRQVYEQEENEKKGKEVAESYVFRNCAPDGELNAEWSFLGKMGSISILGKDIPGLSFSFVPHIEPLKGIYDFDFYFSLGFNGRGASDGVGQEWRDDYKSTQQLQRFQMGGEFGARGKKATFGMSGENTTPMSKRNKDKWIQAELDDICRVQLNKLGTGWFVDAHLGFGWNAMNNEAGAFNLKALEGTVGYGVNWAWNGDFADGSTKLGDFLSRDWVKKYLQLSLVVTAEANGQLSLGFKTYNFKKGNVITKRMFGFYAEVMGYAQAGLKLNLQTHFGQTYGPSPSKPDGNPSMSRRLATSLFYASVGMRAGAKLMLKYGFVWPLKPYGGFHHGGAFLWFLGGDFYAELGCPLGRAKIDWAWKLGGNYIFFPDNANNPSNPAYPNYMGGANAREFFDGPYLSRSLAAPQPSLTRPRLTPRLAASSEKDASKFVLGTNVMENLNERANPQFLGDEHFIITHNNATQTLNDDRVMEYATTQEGTTLMTKADGSLLPNNGHMGQNHHSAKEGDIDLVVSEEMTGDIDIDTSTASIDELNTQAKKAAIVANMRTTKNGEWTRQVVAYDETAVDTKPVGAVNIECSAEHPTAVPTNRAVCLWKRGQYVHFMSEEEIAEAPEDEQAGLRETFIDGKVRAFAGDLMLSTYDGTAWQQPESILKLNKADVLKDYQVVMCNDTVLAAVSLIPQDRDSLELRYYCKPKGQPLQVLTDKIVPVDFSLDMVGNMPFIGILHRPDSTCTDIYVKAIDMKGEYFAYGADLDLEYHSPLSVKLISDKTVEDPEDFAVVWKKLDNGICQDGKYLQTDTTQMMINCSRVFMDYNLTAAPPITLGCSTEDTYISGYDVFLNNDRAIALWTLSDKKTEAAYLMRNEVEFFNDFDYSLSYSQEEMIDEETLPVSLVINNTGNTPIIAVEGKINEQYFKFDQIFISPYSSQILTVDYELPEDFNGLLKAEDVTVVFNDLSYIQRAPHRAAAFRTKRATEDVAEYATGYSDIRCKMLSQSIEGTKNSVYVELTDNDGLNANETVYVGLYPDHFIDEPVCNTAEVQLKAADFTLVNGERKAWVELTADNLSEKMQVYLRARVYNDRVLESLGEDDDILDAVVDNKSWYDNLRVINLLPSERDDATGLPVITADMHSHKVQVEVVEDGVWLRGLETGDYVRVFDAQGMPVYINRTPTERVYVPLRQHGVYLLSTGQEIVKFSF